MTDTRGTTPVATGSPPATSGTSDTSILLTAAVAAAEAVLGQHLKVPEQDLTQIVRGFKLLFHHLFGHKHSA